MKIKRFIARYRKIIIGFCNPYFSYLEKNKQLRKAQIIKLRSLRAKQK